jgi:hypothetical protein
MFYVRPTNVTNDPFPTGGVGKSGDVQSFVCTIPLDNKSRRAPLAITASKLPLAASPKNVRRDGVVPTETMY